MSDDTPTQRFETPTPPAAAQKKRSRLVPLLIITGLILVAAIVVLVIVLISRPTNPQPTALTSPNPTASTSVPVVSATPTPTPSQSKPPAPPPPPQSTDATFTKFIVQTAINSCSSGPYYTGTPPIVKVSWATIRADSAWIVQGTSDAADSGFMQIPLNGSEANFQYSIDFQCGTPSSTYTITLVGSNGKHVSKSWTVKNTSPGQ